MTAVKYPTHDEYRDYLGRHIAFWELAKSQARRPSQVEKCGAALIVLRAALAFLMGESEVPLPSEFDPDRWKAQLGRQI